jgi:hypothetical protein
MKKLLLILLLSVSSAFANLGDTKNEAIKAYGQSIGSDKGLTAYHKGDWLIAEAYDDKGKCVICIYFKLFGAINDEDAVTLDKENFPKHASAEDLQEEKSYVPDCRVWAFKDKSWGVVTGLIAFPVVGKLSARAYVLSGPDTTKVLQQLSLPPL